MYDRKPSPSLSQWYIYFYSVLIQIKVIGQIWRVERDF